MGINLTEHDKDMTACYDNHLQLAVVDVMSDIMHNGLRRWRKHCY